MYFLSEWYGCLSLFDVCILQIFARESGLQMSELINELLQIMTSMGYWGIMIGLMIEVIPSEIVLAYGGLLVYRGDVTFAEAVIFGTIGGTIAQIFVYWIGRYGGRPFLEKYGKFLLINKKHIDVAEAWFNRYGTGVIFTARFIPVVRHAISIPAGIAKMPLSRFALYTTLAVIPWSILFVFLGVKLGELGKSFEQIGDIAGPYVQPFIWISVILTLLYIIYKIVRKRQSGANSELSGNVGAAFSPKPGTTEDKAPGTAQGKAQDKTRDTAQGTTQKMVRDIPQGTVLINGLGEEYLVFNSQSITGGSSTQVVDQLVIGPNGIFHLLTKDWSEEIRLTPKGARLGTVDRYEDVTGPLYRNEYVLKKQLRSNRLEADVVGLLWCVNPDCRLEGKLPAFAAVKAEQILDFIRGYKPKKRLSSDQIGQIVRVIEEGHGAS
ncbi:hypothetical protein J2TS4_46380 [Paenibacillus sp. J2TS4]|nr:hypothetical protein J2TS4_46380 [Paenibacillus sp. J2TS4]